MNYHTPSQAPRINNQISEVCFDPANPEHRKSYASWELTGKWTIRFKTELPYITVPQTVLSAIARHFCNNEFESVANENSIELKPRFKNYLNRW